MSRDVPGRPGTEGFVPGHLLLPLAQSAWDIPYLNRKIFLFRYQIFKSDFFVINFSYFVIRFLPNSSTVKSDNEIGKFWNRKKVSTDQMHKPYASVHFENLAYGVFSPQYVVINNTKTWKICAMISFFLNQNKPRVFCTILGQFFVVYGSYPISLCKDLWIYG